MSKEYSQDRIETYIARLDQTWFQQKRLREMWDVKVTRPFIKLMELDTSVKGLIDKHFNVVEGDDFTRREEKQLANLLKRVD
jgi:hypothetical protein